MDRKKLIISTKARIAFNENLLNNHIEEMYQEDVDRYLILLSNDYQLLRYLEGLSDEDNEVDGE